MRRLADWIRRQNNESAFPAPTVVSLSVAHGSALGGTSVTVTGTAFRAGATVTFGGESCTAVVVVGSTTITCTSPAIGTGLSGAQDVVVTHTDAQTGTLASGWEWDPYVANVTPGTGPAAGGTTLTLTGAGYVAGCTVTVGGEAATAVTRVSATEVTCVTPALPAATSGAQDVVLTNPSTYSSTKAACFTWGPAFTSISTSSGSSVGGTAVTITGNGFNGDAAPTIGGVACTGVTVASATEITATTPAGTLGAKDVVITQASGTATGSGAFTYEYTRAADCDGVDEFSYANDAGLAEPSAWTMMIWCYADAGSGGAPYIAERGIGIGYARTALIYDTTAPDIRLGVRAGGAYTLVSTIKANPDTGAWRFVAVRRDGDVYTGWYGTSKVALGTATSTSTGSQYLMIGKGYMNEGGGSSTWNGKIGRVLLAEEALDDATVALYAADPQKVPIAAIDHDWTFGNDPTDSTGAGGLIHDQVGSIDLASQNGEAGDIVTDYPT